MDQKLIFIHVIGIIILVLSNINETESTGYYCTREGNWKRAMYSCLDHGGMPASYLDIANGTKVQVKEGTTVWTADYVYFKYDKDVTQINPSNYECGYLKFTESYIGNKQSSIYTYRPTNVFYDNCTRERSFICETSSTIDDDLRAATWADAYGLCKPPYKLWSGKKPIKKTSRTDFYTTAEVWVNSVRRLVRGILSGRIANDSHLIHCGTSKGIKQDGNTNNYCSQDLQALCQLEDKTTDTSFSRSCLEGAKPTKSRIYLPSTTPETSKKLTKTSTALATSKATFVLSKLSSQSTETVTNIFNGKKISTTIKSSTLTRVTTKLSNIKTRTTSTKFSTQSREITSEIFSGKKTSTVAMPSTRATFVSTELINSSGLQSMADGLSKTIIIVIVTAATAVIIGCIVTVILLLYFCRKRPGHKDANSHRVQFKRDNPSAARVFLGNNDDANNIASNENKAEVHVHHEACFNVNVPANILEPVNRNETENNEYHYVCNVPENPKPAYNSPRRMSISESEYDTTNNVKVVNESSNIYNRLGYETPEGVYDSTMSKPNRKPALYTNKYSKTSPRENLYDTTKTGVGTSRIHAAISPGDNIYSHAKAN